MAFQPLVVLAGGREDGPMKTMGLANKYAWWGAALAVAAVGWGANQFAPLLLMYESRLGLAATTAEATFGLYALGLVPGLLLGGPISDRYGRRRVMAPALLASLLGTALLSAGGSGVGWLFAGRVIAGVASGAAFSSGAAWIKELSAAASPATSNSGPRRATVAMTVGFGTGPLVAGALAQWGPAPTVLPYLPQLVLASLAFVLVLRTPETRTAGTRTLKSRAAAPGGLWQQLRVPGVRDRRFVTVILPLAPWVFGTAAIALAYLPGLVASRVGGLGLAFSAGVAGLTAGAGIAVQPLARRLEDPARPRLLAVALTIVVAGVLAAAAAAATSEPLLVVVAAILLGAGYGSCQVCGFAEVHRVAGPDELAGLTAVYQAASYLGFALPFLLATAARALPASVLLLIVAALAACTLAWVTRQARLLDRAGRRPDKLQADAPRQGATR
jgi:MFS family permease